MECLEQCREDGAGDNGKNVFEAAIDKLFPEVK